MPRRERSKKRLPRRMSAPMRRSRNPKILLRLSSGDSIDVVTACQADRQTFLFGIRVLLHTAKRYLEIANYKDRTY